MHPQEYPLISVYISEIEKSANKDCNLATVLLIGSVCELLIREIMDDEWTKLETLIDRGVDLEKITDNQAELFNEIRLIRNKYIHINSDKILNDHSHFEIDRCGLLENVNEKALQTFDEKDLKDVLKSHIQNDSRIIFKHFKNLLRLF